jgi:hypothetical protein
MKLIVYLVIGFFLVVCNVWYVRAAYRNLKGGDLIVAPVRLVGVTGDAGSQGEILARMIIARLQSLEWDLQQSQSVLTRASAAPPAASEASVTAGILGTPKTAVLNAQLFEATNIDLKVAGVDVSGFLPRLRRWFVADRIINFSVSWKGTTATVTGSIDALGVETSRPVWIPIKDATSSSIAEAIALTLIHRRWAKDSVEFREL